MAGPASVLRKRSQRNWLEMKRLKIVQAIFTGGFAGSERIVAELCNTLSQKHDVLLLMSTDSPMNEKSIHLHVNEHIKVKRISSFLRAAKVVFETWRFRADIYHGHLGRAVRFAKFLLPPTKRVATWHMGRPIVTTGLDAVTLVSRWQLELSRKGRGAPKIEVISNWVPKFKAPTAERIAELKAGAGVQNFEFILGFVGRASKNKRLQESLQAFVDWNPSNVAFVVVGAEAADLAGGSSFLGDPRIRFLGHQEHVYDFYSMMDCVVFPATNEAFGLVAIEAMQAGCQLILHKSHGLKDIASDNREIIAIDAAQPGQLQQAYVEAFNRRHGTPNYDMSPYDPAERISDMEKLYFELLGHDRQVSGLPSDRSPG